MNKRAAKHKSATENAMLKFLTVSSVSSHSACAPVRFTNRFHSTYGSKLKFWLNEYFNFIFAYLVITYYSLQFLSNGDTK
jgi:hypothetical protein